MLYKFRRGRLLPEFPIYIGGLSSKMTDIYDRRAHMTRRQLPRLQLMRETAPFILNDETVRDAPLRAGTRLRALQWDDDTENTFQCFCASVNRESTAFDLFCRLCQPGISCRSSTRRQAQMARLRLIPTSRPSASAATSNSFSSARTRRGRRSLTTSKNCHPAKLFLCTAIHRPWSGCAATLSAELPRSEVIVPEPGTEVEL